MKRMITTAGLAALGAASIAPTFAQEMTASTKPWSVGLSLRGFYDDNYYTFPGTAALPKLDTFGVDVSPSASINLKRDQTTVGLSYVYSLRYYADRPSPRDDHSHQANLKLSHAFNERYSVDLKDSFVVAQEPSVIDPTISTTTPARSEGDNMRNLAGLQANVGIVENFSILGGYNNTIYDYQQDASDIGGAPGSRSAVLDRMEHLLFADGNYQLQPKTTVSLGYQFGKTDYTSNDPYITGFNGSARDNTSHFASVGVRHHLNSQVDLSAKGGVQYTQYDNNTLFDDVVGPYAEASVRWGYMAGSSIQFGARHQRIPTDVRLVSGAPIADSEATSLYLSWTHQIAAKISVNAMAQYQRSSFGESTAAGNPDATDDLFYGGVTFTYQFTRNVAAELGYTYDRLDSDIPLRDFARNRVFIGTRLTY